MNLLIKSFVSTLLLFFCAINVHSKDLRLYIDHASYKLNNDSIRLNLSWAFSTQDVSKSNLGDSNYQVGLQFSFKLINLKNRKIELAKTWDYNFDIHSTNLKISDDLFGQKTFDIKVDEYKVELYVKDMFDYNSIYSNSFEINLDKFTTNIYNISDISLIYLSESVLNSKTKWDEVYRRFDNFILPNTYKEVYGDNPPINIYFELYKNLEDSLYENVKYQISILDAAKNIIQSEDEKIDWDKDTKINIKKLSPDQMPSGVYYIDVSLIALNNKGRLRTICNKSKKFYYINNSKKAIGTKKFVESMKFEESPFAALDEESTQIEYEQLSYILSPIEKEEYSYLTELKAKQRALFKYWTNRDPNPNTKINEKFVEYQKLIDYANHYFAFGNKEGWQTERGRIVLKYGMPTERVVYPSKGMDQKGAEEWLYAEIMGGVYFFFVDVMSNGNFTLVHSTMTGEIFNSAWFKQYKPAIEDDGSGKYRDVFEQNSNK